MVDFEVVFGFILVGVVFGFGLLVFLVGIWFLFDENVVKLIEKIVVVMCIWVYVDVNVLVDLNQVRYLGDLVLVVYVVVGELNWVVVEVGEVVVEEMVCLEVESVYLVLFLMEILVVIVLVSFIYQIMFYDGQVVDVFGQIYVLCLSVFIFDYFVEEDLWFVYW